MGVGGALLVLFVALKLTDVIAWSWWWVLFPAWLPISIVLVVGVPILGLVWLVGRKKRQS